MLTAIVVMVAYAVHLQVSWAGSPLANPDQYAMLAVYPLVGFSAGYLVRQSEMRRCQRDEVIQRSWRSELLQGLNGLLAALGARDPSALEHARRVAALATRLGEKLELDQDALVQLRLAALVHDIGRIGVADGILCTRHEGVPLADETRKLKIAIEMLGKITGSAAITRIVSAQHECVDGTGYPRSLESEQIPIEARVLHVADLFTELTEVQRGREASTEHAVAAMEPMAGTKIDARCFAALRELVRESPPAEVVDAGNQRSPATGSRMARPDEHLASQETHP